MHAAPHPHLLLSMLCLPCCLPSGQLGLGDTADTNVPTLLPELSAGSISVEALNHEARPAVVYTVPPADRWGGQWV